MEDKVNKDYERFITEGNFDIENGVGLAKHSDLPDILKMIVKMPEESSDTLPPADAYKMAIVMEKNFYDYPYIVYRKEGKVVGCLALTEAELWWSTEKLLEDLFFYVEPEHRSYKITRSLLLKAKEYAKIKGVPLIMGVFSRTDLERKKKVLERNGFEIGGALFISED